MSKLAKVKARNCYYYIINYEGLEMFIYNSHGMAKTQQIAPRVDAFLRST